MRTAPMQGPVALFFLSLLFLLPPPATSQLSRGFSATPDPAVETYQQILDGDVRRVRGSLLVLAIVHSGDNLTHTPVWTANPSRPARWAPSTELSFNGTLTLTDSGTVIWSTSGRPGDMVLFQRMANLQVVKGDIDEGRVWQSYDYPTDTIVEGQNLTAGTPLVSSASWDDPSPGAYSMRLDLAGFGLYADFGGAARLQQYWRREAMQEKAVVRPDGGPVYAQVSVNGFLGMYQNGSAPLDVLSFDSFQRRTGTRILRLEPDGNLKGYYWNVTKWVLDFKAILDPCELPAACGQMGLCQPGGTCRCLDSTADGGDTGSKGPAMCGQAAPAGTAKEGSCRLKVTELRTSGVDVPYEELMGFEKMASLGSCEASCAKNCSCWAAIYNNASGACYRLDYPVQTLLQVPDGRKSAYVKVVDPPRVMVRRKWAAAEMAVVVIGCAVLVVVLAAIGHMWWLSRRRKYGGSLSEGLAPGPYRDLDESSGGSVELSKA
ncbi:PAN domain-containing protein [Nymphaea thermarum]|nr:PAN domain-containing protein [Nymphaea thermarum]